MNSSIVFQTTIKLRGVKALTLKRFVDLMFKSLGSTAKIPATYFDSQDYITNNAFWQDLEEYSLEFGSLKEIQNVITHFGKIFDATKNKENIFVIWQEITLFLSTLLKKCKNLIFLVFAGSFSIGLLANFIKLKNFKDNMNIQQSMSLCLDCISQAAHAMSRSTMDVTNRDTYNFLVRIIDEFLDLVVATKGIFLKDSFEDLTSEILENATRIADKKTNLKYYTIIESMIKSKDEEVRNNMFRQCTQLNVQRRIADIAARKDTIRKEKVKALHIQQDLLKFSRKYNSPFVRNWDRLLGYTLFSHDNAVKKASKELFLLELNGSDNLLERALQIFRVNCDDSYIGDFIEMFKTEENFENCEKLFQLLENHISDTQMCALIILIINAIADDFFKDSTKYDQLVSLMNDIFRCLPFVQSKPNLVYRLINIINIEQFKDDVAFRDKFSVAENYVLNAFYESDSYGTAIGLLEILNRIGFDEYKMYQMFETLLVRQHMNDKTKFYLFMAAEDTFHIFAKVHDGDKYLNYVWFNKCFEDARNPEIKCCYIALIVNILAAYSSTPNIPDMDTNFIKAEALKVRAYLEREMLDKGHSQFTYMNVSTAFCILNSAFSLHDVETKILWAVFSHLRKSSIAFKQRFRVDSREDAEYDFRLITKFWTSLITLYTKKEFLYEIPTPLFQYYIHTEIHLKPYVEEFILGVLNYDSGLFSAAVTHYLEKCTPVTKIYRLITKLFDLVRSSRFACDISAIASGVFLRLLINVVGNGKRYKLAKAVQTSLYVNYLTQHDRDLVLNNIKERFTLTDASAVEINRYKELYTQLQKLNIAPAPTPDTARQSTDLEITFGTDRPSSSRTSGTLPRLSMSLARVNFSFSL